MGLLGAIAVPVLYFGAQIAAAPSYPGYSFARDSASSLGTSASAHPWIFNVGAILTGITALPAAIGLYLALRTSANRLVAWLNGLALVATGVMSVKAGLFPLPDPRHASWGFLTWFTIAMPVLLLIAVWPRREATGLRVYLGASIVLILLLFPVLSGILLFGELQPGTLQRLFALATFVPVGVVGYSLRREL